MKRVFFVALFVSCCFAYGVISQSSSAESTAPQLSNLEEFNSSHQAFIDSAKAKREKFSYILDLLKTALSEELENSQSQCQITEENVPKSTHSSSNTILEEEQTKKDYESNFVEQNVTKQNEIDRQNALHQKIMTKFASAISKSLNDTNIQNNEMPSMIPIFKPRHTSRNVQKNRPDFQTSSVKQAPKSRAVSFIPEKIIQTNANAIPSKPMFKIPCQRAADVLDMTNIAVPKEIVCNDIHLKPKVNPITERTKLNLASQIPAPVTLSVNSSDSEDVAMLFKPKNISLMQLYGNLLKKITITVLVPYHISKLRGKK